MPVDVKGDGFRVRMTFKKHENRIDRFNSFLLIKRWYPYIKMLAVSRAGSLSDSFLILMAYSTFSFERSIYARE